MIILSTGYPTVEVEGEQIAVRFHSGQDTLTVALDLAQAFWLEQEVRAVAQGAMEQRRKRPVPEIAHTATLYAFPRQ